MDDVESVCNRAIVGTLHHLSRSPSFVETCVCCPEQHNVLAIAAAAAAAVLLHVVGRSSTVTSFHVIAASRGAPYHHVFSLSLSLCVCVSTFA